MASAVSKMQETLNAELSQYESDRVESAALTTWFLEKVWRLEPEEVPDVVFDGPGDKGLDALVIHEGTREITLFQAKRARKASVTQGDADMVRLVGAAAYFTTPEAVQGLLDSQPRKELRDLLVRNDIKGKVAAGYKVGRLVFVTSAPLDAAGRDYADAMAQNDPVLDVWPLPRLADVVERTRRESMREETVSLEIDTDPLDAALVQGVRMVVALVSAEQLVRLPGLDDLTLFSRNVRFSAGKTRVNKELASTIDNTAEHALFAAGHNGITVLTREATRSKSALTLHGVSVVNGCQSLLTLARSSSALTPDLRVMVKVVELPEAGAGDDLGELITYRANNQNAVTMRDQRSVDSIQIDLQRGVAQSYAGKFAYLIKSGEAAPSVTRVLDNALAAQLIMAVYKGKPWLAVRKVRLFDHDYYDIFDRDVTPERLFLLFLIDEAIRASRPDLGAELRSSFAAARFTLAHLLAEVLKLTPMGQALLDKPGPWLSKDLTPLNDELTRLAREVVGDLNDYVTDESEETDDFDVKTVFKSLAGVSPARRSVVKFAARAERRTPGHLFDLAP